MRKDYAKNPLWRVLVETVRSMSLYPVHKSYVRERIIPKEPSISAEELAVRLGMPLGEAMVILDELRIYASDLEEELKDPLPAERKYAHVCLGGTFDTIHYGHVALLMVAFKNGKRVTIGVTSDELAKKMGKSHGIKPYSERVSNLRKVLEKYRWVENVNVVKLDDPYGPSITDATLDAIAVSPFTAFRVAEINVIRGERLMRPLEMIECPLVLAEDGKPISSSRIIRGEITPDGRLVSR
ncbi:MAG: hypothetical protein B9J98_04945 [Candidatus Terraquivivens tikiterensis]|uniref:Phosphopantetheine adenylyltransferase n=1 Tax=Candidatus Terraquivivens tikiterensis TaxID=1980982 RepID=A0A2R7Y574_9ARCH|nr:MAG: hypothetical protein B9J98_04945 [Candidatus Terraquivivens tikiterensis]